MQAVKAKAPIGQAHANMALGVVLGQLASMPALPQADRADYHDEALLALQQAVACDPADISILYNLALVQVSISVNPARSPGACTCLQSSCCQYDAQLDTNTDQHSFHCSPAVNTL